MQEQHFDVAAYALGVLDERDAARFEDHLIECTACALELETLLPVVNVLADVDADAMVAAEQSRREGAVLKAMITEVGKERHHARSRRLYSLAAAVVVFAMLAVGALAGAVSGLFVDNLVVEVLVALAVSVAMLFVVRPIALRHLRTPHAIRTGVAALIGERAVVTEQVDGHSGRIKLRGEVWSARTYDPSHVIEAGRYVDVVQIEGATAVVLESEV